MKTVIIGSEGFVGKSFLNKYSKIYSHGLSFSHKSKNPLFRLNLSDPDLNILDQQIDDSYSYALITAGITNIALCEKEKDYTYHCNVLGTLKLAKYFHDRNITPIIFSSDYVFDGKTGNYDENSSLNPLNEYGRQKAEIEEEIKNLYNDNYLILKLSKVYSISNDNSLLNEMIRSCFDGKIIRAAYDQIFNPICISDLIDIIFDLQKKGAIGLFNICGEKSVNRYELAQKISSKIQKNNDYLQKISLEDLNEAFLRPKNTSMNCKKLLSIVNIPLKPINFYIKQAIKNYLSDKK